jgi:hypothetical protein
MAWSLSGSSGGARDSSPGGDSLASSASRASSDAVQSSAHTLTTGGVESETVDGCVAHDARTNEAVSVNLAMTGGTSALLHERKVR